VSDAETGGVVVASLWRELTGEPLPPLDLTGTATLPGAFRIADAAVGSVGAALVAAGRWLGARRVSLDVAAAAGVFLAERRLLVDGAVPVFWDPLAGDYRAADGWVRLHTNYAAHRAATLRALLLSPDADRADVTAAVARRSAVEIEEAVVAAGAAAAALRTRNEWRVHPQYAAVAARPLVEVTPRPSSTGHALDPSPGLDGPVAQARPGVPHRWRVLDLTRVIAGPTATKVLAAVGADVLRLDAPGFEEVPSLVADTSAGKRCARFDLRDSRTEELVAAADVLVCGLRPGALARLGWPPERLAEANPGLVVAELSAYGDTGPWGGRRGFDSLVQIVSGIAAEGMQRAGAQAPVPLPAQALDHASGWLLAAGVLHALRLRRDDGRGRHVGVVLARTAQWLDALGRQDDSARAPGPRPGLAEPPGEVEVVASPFGSVTRVICPGAVDGEPLRWGGAPSPLGSSEPIFA
jgi:crotonobetainyl-CoA:carnitine CoA-transferase CaiB-like acyl-CoA transferase